MGLRVSVRGEEQNVIWKWAGPCRDHRSFVGGDTASPVGMASEDRDRMGGVPRGKGAECPRQVWEVRAEGALTLHRSPMIPRRRQSEANGGLLR